ncbi:hypothetical protein EYD45_04675 [Hyunsoonleella flava]|uniref:Fibronectin type-III domain-containing protein n=1 Tax=Hyunsoonleella flava TaxID=2527939 RepID=A0A4Q9FKW1_9FLAO|nr:hypothetical protein [Hyunsoonleella flava]TBN05575.1 hypothetical protein EYD45_04675 [Hyunsoonleella flava]
MKKSVLLFSILTIICFNCSYNFSEDNLNEIDRPSTKNNSILISNFKNGDTINSQRVMTYTFEGPSNPFRAESIVYLDGEKIGAEWNAETETGRFSLYPARYKDGIHKLRFEHSFFSGSGSIADQLGQEVLTKIEEFNFVVRRKTSTPPPITEVKIENGSITVKWGEMNGNDYEKAYLSIKFKESEQKVPLSPEILSQKKFIDKTTVLHTGNRNTPFYDYYSKAEYSILLTNQYTDNYGSSKEIEYNIEWFEPKIVFNGFNDYIIKWPSHPLYGNFENLQISGFLGSSAGGEMVVDRPFIFGSDYTINFKPKVNLGGYEIYSFRNAKLDEDTFGSFNFGVPNYKGIVYHTTNEKYYILVNGARISNIEGYELYIYEYSKDMEFIRRNYISNSEALGRHLSIYIDPLTQNFYVDTFNSSYLIDKDDLSIIKQVTGSANDIRKVFRGNIVITRTGYFPTHTTIENIQTNTIIRSGNSIGSVLSDDAKYIFIADENGRGIYEIDGNQLSKIIDIIEDDYVSKLIVVGNRLIYSHYSGEFSGKFSIADLNTNTKKTFEFGTYQKSMQYDPVSEKLLLINNGGAGIFDINSDILETFHYEHINGGGDHFVYLQNERLFHTKGIYIDNF